MYLMSKLFQQSKTKETNETVGTATEIQEIQLTDNTGTIRLKKQLPKGSKSAKISTSALKSGVYVIRIFDGTEWHSQQLIIQH